MEIKPDPDYSKEYHEGRSVAYRYTNDDYKITCPYPEGSFERKDWMRGFDEGFMATMAAGGE